MELLYQSHGFCSDLKMQLTESEQQMSNNLELTNEMNSLLAQRACRIKELENMLGSFNPTSDSGLHEVGVCYNGAAALVHVP